MSYRRQRYRKQNADTILQAQGGAKKMKYTLAAMTIIRKLKKVNVVSAKQIDALADFIKSKEGKNERINYNDIYAVIYGAK
jgi:hypothetical protein